MLTIVSLLPSVPALVLGIVALNQIQKRGEHGRGLAIAGIIARSIDTQAGIVLVLMPIALAF